MSSNAKPNWKFLKFMLGSALLVVGISLILVWSGALMILVKGSIGFILAVAGLLTLYSIQK